MTYIEGTIKPALGSMSIVKLHAKLVDRTGRISPLRAARHRSGLH